MKIIIIGATGTLGRAMLAVFPHALAPSRAVWRQTLHVKGEAGDIVINCAGNVNQELTLEELREGNSDLPKSIYATCTSKGMKLIHFSSDCIFDGQPHFTTSHNEASGPVSMLCSSQYGKSKLLGEERLWSVYDGSHNLIVIRCSFVGPGNPKGLFEVAKSSASMDGFLNHYWNGLSSTELAKTIEKILRSPKLSTDAFRKGLLHIFSPHIVSKYELLRLLAGVFKDRSFRTLRPVLAPQELRRTLTTIHEEFYEALNIPNLITQFDDPIFAALQHSAQSNRPDSATA